jgi:ESCRT-II complex subunit VPS25
VEGWVESTGQKGSVLTLYELIEGDGTRGTGEFLTNIPFARLKRGEVSVAILTGELEFHGLDQQLLLKALNVLVKRGKAQVFGQEDSQGVKFF